MMSELEALQRAQEIATERGWAWQAPAQAIWRPAWFGKGGKWEVLSNTLGKGAKVRIVLDAQSGAVLEQGYLPR